MRVFLPTLLRMESCQWSWCCLSSRGLRVSRPSLEPRTRTRVWGPSELTSWRTSSALRTRCRSWGSCWTRACWAASSLGWSRAWGSSGRRRRRPGGHTSQSRNPHWTSRSCPGFSRTSPWSSGGQHEKLSRGKHTSDSVKSHSNINSFISPTW